MILLVRELTGNLPPVAEIELHGNRIRANDAKTARLVTTESDLSFTPREQFASNTLSTVLAKYPQVANPLLIRYDHAHNLFIRDCHPSQRPILVFELQRNRIRSKKIAKCSIRHCLYQSPYRAVFAGLGSPNSGHPAILVERRRAAHLGDAPPFAVFERWDRVRSHKPQKVLRLRIAASRTPRDAGHTPLDPLSGIWATRLVNWKDPLGTSSFWQRPMRTSLSRAMCTSKQCAGLSIACSDGIRPAGRRTLLSFSSSMKSGSLLLTHMMLVGFRSKLTVQR
jgi:hypothetical protein